MWLARALVGPTIWAVGFAAVYALHGAGCALGWAELATPAGTVHRLAMLAGWAATLAAGVLALALLPAGPGLPGRLPRSAAWIGLGATAFTLSPLVAASSC